MKRIGIAELKDGLSAQLRAVEAGDSVEVTDRGRAIARIVPAAPGRTVTIVPARRSFRDVRHRTFAPLRLSLTSGELLEMERADRALPGSG
jgi:prevent-host-death family protein